MAITSLRIDDDLLGVYQAEAEASGGKLSLEHVLADRLKRAEYLVPNSRYIVLADAPRDQMEKLLGGGSLRSGDDLLEKVSRLARVRFGDHTLEDLTPGQMEELVYRAEKMGKTVDQLLQETWAKFRQDFFTLVR